MSISRWRNQFRDFQRRLPRGTKKSVVLASFLEAMKVRTRTSSGTKDVRHGKKLYRRSSQKILKKIRQHRKNYLVANNPKLLLFRSKPDELRDTLSPKYSHKFSEITKRIRDRKSAKIDLKDFSFSRNPRGTMAMLRELVRLSATHIDIKINFPDSTCDDVAPYIVLSQIIRTLPPIFSGGTIHPEVAAVVESVGLTRPLGIGKIFKRNAFRPLVLPFKMRSRTPPKKVRDKDFQLKPQAKEDVSDAFCDTLNDWLQAYELSLTAKAEQKLVDSINEALDNAERHGIITQKKLAGEWLIAGFSRLSFDDEGPSQIRCSFAIVSIGRSISETLQLAPPTVTAKVQEYLDIHHAQTADKRALLTTVMALQDGITRIPEASAEGRGGVGMMELVGIFADLGDNDDDELQSVFTVLSGTSCLRITVPYRSGAYGTDPHFKELWFNDRNERSAPPSADHAFSLNERLAGTVLSASFVMDREFLAKRFDEQHSNGSQSRPDQADRRKGPQSRGA